MRQKLIILLLCVMLAMTLCACTGILPGGTSAEREPESSVVQEEPDSEETEGNRWMTFPSTIVNSSDTINEELVAVLENAPEDAILLVWANPQVDIQTGQESEEWEEQGREYLSAGYSKLLLVALDEAVTVDIFDAEPVFDNDYNLVDWTFQSCADSMNLEPFEAKYTWQFVPEGVPNQCLGILFGGEQCVWPISYMEGEHAGAYGFILKDGSMVADNQLNSEGYFLPEEAVGRWVLDSMIVEGYESPAEEEGMSATIDLYMDDAGTLYLDYACEHEYVMLDITELNGVEATYVDEVDPDSVFAPAYISFPMYEEPEETALFLIDENTLELQHFYYLDGSPNISVQIYHRAEE